MAKLPKYFELFKTNIEPDEDRQAYAKELPAKVRKHLQESTDFETVSPHTRLAGSYSRHTTINHIKDVDILVFVPKTKKDESAAAVLRALKKALEELPADLTMGVEPELVHQRRSIRIELKAFGFVMDIVPVIAKDDDVYGKLLIPDRTWEKWVETQPLGYGNYLTLVNGEHGSRVVPLVKMFKHWRDHNMKRLRPKSFWLELMVVNIFATGKLKAKDKSDAELVSDLFTAIYDQYKPYLDSDGVPSVKDPMLGGNVAFNWDRVQFESFMNRLKTAKDTAAKALATDDTEKAVAYWQSLFGDHFPSTHEVATAYGKAAEEGRLHVSVGSSLIGQLSMQGSRETPTRPAPATRFWSDAETKDED